MSSGIEEFNKRLINSWVKEFCNDGKRQYTEYQFKTESIKISEFDASNFLRALDKGIVKNSADGRFRCERSGTFEQIFWTGLKSVSPRPLTLWIEPVITIGTMARLGLDYHWLSRTLCMQTKGWAFDFAVFREKDDKNEYIAGEVKKSEKEIDGLVNDLIGFARLGVVDGSGLSSKKVNSFKKWNALQKRRVPLFWAVGPNDYTRLFSVKYFADNTAILDEVQLTCLTA